jgi:putative FmdB family regulatory protein
MPVYAYQCRTCNHAFEARQGFNDMPLTDCPSCDAEGSVFRVIQPAGVVFKGSGWYVTDSRGKRDSLNGSSSSKTGTDKSKGAVAESTGASTPAMSSSDTPKAAASEAAS